MEVGVEVENENESESMTVDGIMALVVRFWHLDDASNLVS